MKIVAIFACLLIVALDVTAGILGIKAEAAQNQVDLKILSLLFHIEIEHGIYVYFLLRSQQEKQLRLLIFECKEPSHQAFVLGVAAATLLCLAHVLTNLLGGCNLCTRGELSTAPPSKQLSMACLLLTWYGHKLTQVLHIENV